MLSNLYKGKETFRTTSEAAGMGKSANDPLLKSAAHEKVSKNNQTKLSFGGIVAERLLMGDSAADAEKIGIGVGDGFGYAEIRKGSQIVPLFVDMNCKCVCVMDGDFDEKDPYFPYAFSAALLAFALNDEHFPETQSAFLDLKEQYEITGTTDSDTMFRLCDALYYEMVIHGVVNQIPPNKVEKILTKEYLNQSFRTGNLNATPYGVALSIPDGVKECNEAEKEVTTTEPLLDLCKRGDFRISATKLDLDTEQESLIPELEELNTFVSSDQFETLVKLIDSQLTPVIQRMDEGVSKTNEIIGDNYVNAILCGKPGTGKTTLAKALGAVFGLPVVSVPLSKNTEEDTFQGMTKVSEGGFKFVSTPFLDIYTKGGIILLEEFNLANPSVVMGAIGQAIEKPFILYEDGYKERHRHPLCVVIATMNTGTQGSREPSEAFTSRCPYTFILDDPDEEQFISILQKTGSNKKNCRLVYKEYTKVLSVLASPQINAPDVAMSITLRHCLAALRLMEIGYSVKDAFKASVIGAIAPKDVELASQVFDMTLAALPDK